MKKLTLLTTLTITLMFSPVCWGKWSVVRDYSHLEGPTYYLDFDRIRQRDGYVYYWEMTNPSIKGGSQQGYNQGDCGVFRVRNLKSVYYRGLMGRGGVSFRLPPDSDWTYVDPGSAQEDDLKAVCDFVKRR